VAADAIEASVAMDSLLGGQLRADEIRVTNPRVAIGVEADGARTSRVSRGGSRSAAAAAVRMGRW